MIRTPLLIGTAAVAVLCAAGPAGAATPDHETQDITGATFVCGGTVLTATGGTLSYDYHAVTSGSGITRDNGNGVVHDGTLVDPAGATYTLGGAFTFTDKYDPISGAATAGTVTDNLVIHNAGGGFFARVGLREHLDSDGRTRVFHPGACTDDN